MPRDLGPVRDRFLIHTCGDDREPLSTLRDLIAITEGVREERHRRMSRCGEG